MRNNMFWGRRLNQLKISQNNQKTIQNLKRNEGQARADDSNQAETLEN